MSLGLFIRAWAMVAAGKNFHHIVQEHNPGADHELITGSIYSCCRHPSYAGFYWWSVGSQIVLVNPVSVFLFMLANHMFFSGRIPHEEYYLINAYRGQYVEYRDRTRTWIPFIK